MSCTSRKPPVPLSATWVMAWNGKTGSQISPLRPSAVGRIPVLANITSAASRFGPNSQKGGQVCRCWGNNLYLLGSVPPKSNESNTPSIAIQKDKGGKTQRGRKPEFLIRIRAITQGAVTGKTAAIVLLFLEGIDATAPSKQTPIF